MVKIRSGKNEYAIRVKSPKKFDKRSIRTVKKKNVNIIVGCPKGKFDAEKENCKVGMQTQAYRLKKRKYTKKDAREFAKRHGL